MKIQFAGLLVFMGLQNISAGQQPGASSRVRPPECPAAALDANLAFSNDPSYENTVAINYQNISQYACTLNGGVGAMFDNWHEGHNIWAKECRNCDASGTSQPVPPLVLEPGESGYFLLRWKNVSDGITPCVDADGLNTKDETIVAPSLLSHLCSTVDERSFFPGIFPAGGDAGGGQRVAGAGYSVELTAPTDTLYAGDRFPFRALLNDPKAELPLDAHSCPTLFIRTRDSRGFNSFQQISQFLKCKLSPAPSGGRSIDVEMQAPGLGVLNIPGSTSVRFFLLAAPAQAGDDPRRLQCACDDHC